MDTWKSDLCDLCADGGTSCLCATLVPCVKYPLVASDAGFGIIESLLSEIIPFWFCISGAMVRYEIRRRRGIAGTCMSDLCVFTVCMPCSLVQMSNELHQQNTEARALV